MIEVEQLSKSFGPVSVLKGLTFRVGAGETIVMVGPSGSGKSTLLRCINGLERFDSGRVRVEDLELRSSDFDDKGREALLRKLRLRVGMVFQSFNLFPHLDVLSNIILAPVQVTGEPRDRAEQRALNLLERVNLRGKEKAYPESLSGGEQQRVAIARALAMNPQVMLFDEPTSALDPELVGEVLGVISDLADEGYTLLIVTHQMHFARRSADRVLFLDSGKILEEGVPAEFFSRPATQRARDFLEGLH